MNNESRMEKEYSQLHDFKYGKVKKMENSSYLEELTGLLERVATKIDIEENYFFENEYYVEGHKEEPNSSFPLFIEKFKSTIYYGTGKTINIIRGRAGIGKSLFFKRGAQLLIKSTQDKNHYIYMGVDFKNIDNDKSIEFYEEWINKKLRKRAIQNIKLLGKKVINDYMREVKEFEDGLEEDDSYSFPLKFFCEHIYDKYKKPCIIFFDNIDLASVKTQKNVFAATINICDEFSEFMELYRASDCYRVYFAMRPETELRYTEGRIGEVINFPLPNVLQISLAIIKKALSETAAEFDKKGELLCNITCQNVISDEDEMKTFETFSQVADYFYSILEYYLSDIWNQNPHIVERLGTSETFHCNIVNYNVRTFVRFLADTIRNGGFKPFTKEFNNRHGVKYYSVYDYIEMLIRGRWPVHPGNLHINGEGSNKAPIVFNVFDTSIYGNSNKNKVKHFMLNIRILQYFLLCGDNLEIRYGEMKKIFLNFFEEEYIDKATQKLIYVRFLYSYIQGDNIIATIRDCKDVYLDDATMIKLSPVGKFYLEHMICEFEYLYQMAVTALMCEEYVMELQSCWETEKEKTVLCFLKSMFEIIKENIRVYRADEIKDFKNLFYCIDDQLGSRPYRKMLNRFILVMRNKVQRAEKMKTSSITKLNTIYEDAISLDNEVKNYLQKMFD